MTVLLEGTDDFDFRVQKGRIEYDAVANIVGPAPVDGLMTKCLAVIVLDGRNPYDFGNGVAAGVMLKGPKTIPAGWFDWRDGRRYREEIAAIGIAADEPVLCFAKLCGGAEIRYRKGPMRLPFHLSLDLAWPIRTNPDWHTACAPFLREVS